MQDVRLGVRGATLDVAGQRSCDVSAGARHRGTTAQRVRLRWWEPVVCTRAISRAASRRLWQWLRLSPLDIAASDRTRLDDENLVEKETSSFTCEPRASHVTVDSRHDAAFDDDDRFDVECRRT